MQHVIDKADYRDSSVTFYISAAMRTALHARAALEERSLSSTVAGIVRDALKDLEPAGNGLEVTTSPVVRRGFQA
jgi:hypothetical protein